MDFSPEMSECGIEMSKNETTTTMMLVQIAQAGAMAVVATLAITSTNNILQTIRETRKVASLEAPMDVSGLCLEDLQRMKRQELLRLFLLANKAPSIEQIEGEWEGMLLENNGRVMTAVSEFLTHVLFSNGLRWNGKAFSVDGKGRNRFSEGLNISTDHTFDFQTESSSLGRDSSMVLRYAKHQNFKSTGWKFLLWKSMVDEVRVLKLNDGQFCLLGIGSMAWSGGVWNGSIFCLFKDTKE